MKNKTLCSAAWTDLNVDFANQTIKHCCMMRNEKFPEHLYDEFWNNSKQIQETRNDLLNGIEAPACSYCWSNNNTNSSRYRDIKNRWKTEKDFNTEIKNIEITLDNLCDMSCVYCFEDTSSRIAQEKGIPEAIKTKPKTEYIDSFINFLVKLAKTQSVSISFSGGEITYSKNFFSFINKLLSIPELYNAEMYISVITNCNSLEKNQKKMINLLDHFPKNWNFDIAISNESTGNVTELVRYGLNWDRFQTNYKEYISHPRINSVIFAPAFSIFTVKDMYNYFEFVIKEADKLGNKVKVSMFGNWIQNPKELDPAQLPDSYKSFVIQTKNLFSEYKHLFGKNFDFSINSLTVLENRIGTKKLNESDLKEWINNTATIKKDSNVQNLWSLI
jgi:sulfatase maturation enzyme AslB (radical SAM superfamily)